MEGKRSHPPPAVKKRTGHGDEMNTQDSSAPNPKEVTDADMESSPCAGEVEVGPWGRGGALLATLSVCADAVLNDESKTVRTKALTCALRVLETQENGSKVVSFAEEAHGGLDPMGHREKSSAWQQVQRTLAAVSITLRP